MQSGCDFVHILIGGLLVKHASLCVACRNEGVDAVLGWVGSGDFASMMADTCATALNGPTICTNYQHLVEQSLEL